MDKTVKLMTCENSFQANLIKGKLASEGIPSMLKNENFNFIYGGLNNSSLGVDIVVLEDDLERALKVIEEHEGEEENEML